MGSRVVSHDTASCSTGWNRVGVVIIGPRIRTSRRVINHSHLMGSSIQQVPNPSGDMYDAHSRLVLIRQRRAAEGIGGEINPKEALNKTISFPPDLAH